MLCILSYTDILNKFPRGYNNTALSRGVHQCIARVRLLMYIHPTKSGKVSSKTIRLFLFVIIVSLLLGVWVFRGTDEGPGSHRIWRKESGTSQPLFCVRVQGKWGFIDRRGNIVIQPRFQHALSFSEGLAPVMQDEKWGYITEDGKWAIEPQFAMASLFSESLASVRRTFTDDFGYIDRTGKIVIQPAYDSAGYFIDGVARVGNETIGSMIRTSFADVGLTCSYFYVDKNGQEVPKPEINVGLTPSSAPAVSNGLEPFKMNGKMGFKDASGKIVIAPRFDYVARFEDGLALFTTHKGARAGYLDETGRIVWEATE